MAPKTTNKEDGMALETTIKEDRMALKTTINEDRTALNTIINDEDRMALTTTINEVRKPFFNPKTRKKDLEDVQATQPKARKKDPGATNEMITDQESKASTAKHPHGNSD